ncbi:unnamed protein product [Phytophthora lilii]|uniref:Unnamed protein product n=1 Tax=Phytophthora lilii TaxID=2077276 RepID=A0A9W6TR51_9STRA|nr:unnamed protein product [Phytophthora lilii]
MRLQYVAVVAAVALAASSDGLQIAPNSAKSTSLRASADVRYQPYVEGKSERFLISESKNHVPTESPTGYDFAAQQEDDDLLYQVQQDDDDDDYEDDDSESSSSDGSSSNERFWRRKKKKRRKKHKHTETPTPTPTGWTATPTPAPTTEKPSRARRFVSWLDRVFGD